MSNCDYIVLVFCFCNMVVTGFMQNQCLSHLYDGVLKRAFYFCLGKLLIEEKI